MRWWWRAHKEPDSLITSFLVTLHSTHSHSDGPPRWKKTGSFFRQHMLSIRPMFLQSTTLQIGCGAHTSFWHDPWCGLPLANIADPPPWSYQQKISVRNVASCIEALLPRPRTQRQEEATHKLTSIVFNESNDMMLWKLNTTRIYSAKSFYDFYAGLGKIMWEFHALWRAKAPHRFESSIFLCCTTSCSRNRSCKRGNCKHIRLRHVSVVSYGISLTPFLPMPARGFSLEYTEAQLRLGNHQT
jgi:hypothetical protein